ncbi:cyanidin 3-O-galactoside 2''-O-xylosyltransferase FGGT1-like [Arachis stenosperma]|uniref:cyanidin 3-O-galactoside 2''-O-xylosyltransferase FGGT1-like n=1 Tax=Arachis stenosperma TaxID=217475 RepID=UPI0025AD5743|nr:cyanidin 3-O-galactoside 2''-O-xylosyltransferase FGGT1-like [Arachis stenosperma]
MDASSPLHIAMFPWFAMGHLIPYLHLSNKLAKRGHRISFFTPKRTQSKLQHLNLHPHLITFIPITVPHVDTLPLHAETTSDVPFSSYKHIATAMDHTEKDIELLLQNLKPQIVLFDFQHWLPNLARSLGIKSVQYQIGNPATFAYLSGHTRGIHFSAENLMKPPQGFPDSSIRLRAHEAQRVVTASKFEFGSGITLYDRFNTGTKFADAMAYKGCKEIDGDYINYMKSQLERKPIMLSGPLLPEPTNSTLDEKWDSWLSGFNTKHVIYCALGSECSLNKSQLQELVLGLELTGFPFLAALKPPVEFDSIEQVLPEGFKERVEGSGVVYDGWVQQQLILEHPSVGCFITHCGAASITEALVSSCQLVLLPGPYSDHAIAARNLGSRLKVGIEVEKGEEDGLFSKENVCIAVKTAMDDENQVGKEIRENHSKIRNLLLSNDFESSCIDGFVGELQSLL